MPIKRVKNQIDLFRVNIALLMRHHTDLLKIYIMHEKLSGASLKNIRETRKDPLSSWSKQKNGLNNAIKREVAGLINEIHQIAYLEPLK